ncbi:SGNH/GDSL hydrolase family protein [Serratia entomophila]|uniref:SGNH/GDSL hydrolase family protein n=1 Tax=Serratia entomophila TaxID=42906 RepID=UPI00217B8623|nr:SGNH/GDSL hydrolase family protein [Serratia entomophila]CAI0730835.1 Uncharacterised protein [Serratia entomophila]CAI1696994.1 Uncharacterised protein [Serratia entomophila]CAI2447105.1 Uncharacterised protein [Serratia entomophila]
MTNIIERANWEEDIHLIARGERVAGGYDGAANIHGRQLANRTAYLKKLLDTLSGMQMTAGKFYDSADTAQQAINDGLEKNEFFSVRSDNDEYWVDRYQNINGSATKTDVSLLSEKGLINLFRIQSEMLQDLADYIMLREHGGILADANNVPAFWLGDKVLQSFIRGNLDIRGITTNTMITLEQTAGRDPLIDKILRSFEKMPIWWVGDKVGLWYDAADKLIHSAYGFAGVAKQKPMVLNSHVNSRARAKAHAIKNKSVANVSLRILGGWDSWNDYTTIPLAFENHLKPVYGDGGSGIVDFYPMNPMPGITIASTGFARLHRQTGPFNEGMGVNGRRLRGTTAGCTANITGMRGDTLAIIYQDLTGSFEYSVDGASPVTVTGTNTNKQVALEIPVLAAGTHSIAITTTTNPAGGIVNLFFMRATFSAGRGVAFLKAGQQGMTAAECAPILPSVPDCAKNLNPDVVLITLATNEIGQKKPVSEYRGNLFNLAKVWRDAVGDSCGVNIVFPAQANRLPADGFPEYAPYEAAARSVAEELEIGYLDMFHAFPSNVVARDFSMFQDRDHLNASGADYFAQLVIEKLLEI